MSMQPAMNISFRNNDPTNTSVVDTNTGAPLYEIETPRSFFKSRTTTIRRIYQQGSPSRVVSQIKWSTFSPDLVSVDGNQWTKVNSFLVKGGIFSESRTFVTVDGAEYKWKSKSDKFTLVERGSRTVVARSHRHIIPGWILNPFAPRPDMSIDIMPSAVSILDIVVLTFIIMEKKRQERSRADAGTGT